MLVLKRLRAAMKASRQLTVLLDLAEQLGISVRAAPSRGGAGHPGGALVRLKGKEVLFLDPSAGVADQVSVVADALRGRARLAEIFLPPEVRELIEGEDDDQSG